MIREELVAELEQSRPVEPWAIEGELGRLWQRATQPIEGWSDEEEKPIARSCVSNLLIVVDGDEQAARASKVVRLLAERHPARSILLQMIPDSLQAAVEAAVRAHCRLPAWSRSYVCCEEIALVVRGRDAVRHVRGNLLPLLIADLPSVLWWSGSPFDHPLVGRLAELCDHFVVDSAGFSQLAAGFAGLLAVNDQSGISVDCRDLSWARLTPWRSLIAQFFDSAQVLPFLDAIDYVTISYCHDYSQPNQTPNLAQALLLAGWLASRQGWQRADPLLERRGERLLFRLQHGPQTVTVDLRPNDEHPQLPPGSPVMTRLQVRGANPRAEFNVARLDDPAFVLTLTHAGARQPVSRVARIGQPDIAQLIGAELDLPGRDSTFIMALRAATPLAQAQAAG